MPTNPNDMKKQSLAEMRQKDGQSLSEWEKLLLGEMNFESFPDNLPRVTKKPMVSLPSWLIKLIVIIGKLRFKTPRDFTWTAKAPLNRPRVGLTALTVNQKIWVMGGLYEDGNIADIEVYDPVTNVWSVIPNPPYFYGQAFVVVGNDLIYAVGELLGSNPVIAVFEYNTQTNTLTQKADLPIPCQFPGIAVGRNGEIYVMGGYSNQSGSMEYLDAVQKYDILTNTWAVKTPMPIPRYSFCAITGTDRKIYVMGGRTRGNNVTDRVDAYNPRTGLWIQQSSMPNTKSEFPAVLLKGNIYAIGGNSNSWPYHVDEFNYKNNIWTSRGQFPKDNSTRWCLGAAALGNSIYAIGGLELGGNASDISEKVIVNTVEEGLPSMIEFQPVGR